MNGKFLELCSEAIKVFVSFAFFPNFNKTFAKNFVLKQIFIPT